MLNYKKSLDAVFPKKLENRVAMKGHSWPPMGRGAQKQKQFDRAGRGLPRQPAKTAIRPSPPPGPNETCKP
jgi:hypothetical protein